jgi:putative tryptophan/tyrosine transport system substrate-binding protein
VRRREFIALLGSAAAVVICRPLAAAAAPNHRMRRIGLLLGSAEADPQAQLNVAVFAKALEELGWKDNIRFDIRWAAGRSELAKESAKELVELAPDVIVAGSGAAALALRDATRSIPVVFVGFTDPVADGLVETLARPGRNMTGFPSVEFSVAGKWLDMLKGIARGITRVAAIYHPETAPYGAQFVAWSKSVATALAIELAAVPVRNEEDIAAVVAGLGRGGAGGLLVLPDPFNAVHKKRIAALAADHRVPAIYPGRDYAAAGGLVSYGIELAYLFRQAASYVDRILRGARPGELPVQAPTKFALVVNLQAAKALGVEIPPTLLAIADEVIE